LHSPLRGGDGNAENQAKRCERERFGSHGRHTGRE
jgi:hypothetical protein